LLAHAASAVVALASAMAMASMFAATRALSTTAFCPAKVMALGVPFSMQVDACHDAHVVDVRVDGHFS